MKTVRNLIMTGQPGFSGTDAAPPGSGTAYSPIIRADAAVDHLLMFTVESVLGGPSAASVGLTVRGVQPTTNAMGSTAYVTDNNPVFFDLTVGALASGDLLESGSFPAVLADQTLAAPVTKYLKIRGGFRFQFALVQSFTGGTLSRFKMSASLVSRYG